ncbi:hypothetical protein CHUAL_003303 [Chamberlinius hualienensis]
MVLEKVTEKALSAFGAQLTLETIRYNGHCISFSVEKRFNYKCWSFLFATITTLLWFCSCQHLSPHFHVIVAIALCSVIALSVHLKIRKESLLAVSELGLQITTTFVSGRESTIFIDHSHIDSILINEGITMQCVLYYLVALIKFPNKATLVPIFTALFPRYNFIRQVYHKLNEIL